MSQNIESDILPYSSINLGVGRDEAMLTAICYGVRLHIEVTNDSLGAEQDAADPRLQLGTFLEAIDNEPDQMQNFKDWLVRPCQGHIRAIVNLDNHKAAISLQDYYHGPTVFFILENQSGQLVARKLPDDPATRSHMVPKDPDVSDWEYHDIPKIVQNTSAGGQQFYFKAAVEKGLFVRELDVLIRLKEIDRATHVTRIAGLVTWDDNDFIGGLLIEYIPSAETLDWAMNDSTQDDRSRWMAEIRDIVGQLHDADIVWGDVKPQNVLIDEKRDAWVVDFGGGHSLPWVGKDMEDTVRGDLHGLDAIAEYLGL